MERKLLEYEYPDIYMYGELVILRAERDHWVVRELEARISELGLPARDLRALDARRADAEERARTACQAMITDVKAGLLSSRAGPALDRLLDALCTTADTDVEHLQRRLQDAREAVDRDKRMLGEVGPGIRQVLELMGDHQERELLRMVTQQCGVAVVPLIRLIRYQHLRWPLSNKSEELDAACKGVQRLMADIREHAPFFCRAQTLSVDIVSDAIGHADVGLIANVEAGSPSTELADSSTWPRGSSVVGAAARVLGELGLEVPLEHLYHAIKKNERVREEAEKRSRLRS